MSDQVDNPAAEQAEAETVAGLMGADAVPPAQPDLESSAMAAAEQAIAKAELALAAAQIAATEAPAPTKPDGDRSWMLQIVLLLNMVLMGVMLALPNPDPVAPKDQGAEPDAHGGGDGAATGDGHGDAHGNGHAADAHASGAHGGDTHADGHGALQPVSSEAWLTALQAAGEGDVERAAHALEGYLERNPNLPTFERRMYLSALVNYLTESGRQEDAEHYLGELMALVSQSYLPADILRLAREAKDKGEGARMRQLLARFLLTQKKHTAAERRAVAEAYVELGDSYRIQAARGEERAAVMLRMREAKLRSETRARRTRDGNPGGDK